MRDTDPPPKNGAPRRGCAFGFGGEADGPNDGIPRGVKAQAWTTRAAALAALAACSAAAKI